jgi:hypothetical protein
MMNGMRSFYVVRDSGDEPRLNISRYLSGDQIKRLADEQGFIVWLYKGLALLIPAFRIGNLARLIDVVPGAGRNVSIEVDAAIRLNPELAEALLGNDLGE